MALFGRKSSTPPAPIPAPPASATDVPPELQPYYLNTPAPAPARLRRVGLFVLPVVVFIAVLALLIGGTLWLRHHSVGDIFGGSKGPTPSSSPNDTAPSTDVTNPGTTDATPAPAPTPTPSTTSPVPSPAPVPAAAVPPTAPATGAMPTTGPNDSLFAFAAVVAAAGALSFHIQQVRRTTVRG